MNEDRKPRANLIDWMARAAVALFLLIPGLEKFSSEPDWVTMFARIGLGQWFRVFTGVLEVVGAVLFVLPRSMRLGAAMMIVVMVGAMAAHIFILGDPVSSIVPAILIAAIVVVYRRSCEANQEVSLRLDGTDTN